ncbi:MAG: L-threonylcarbamoyladenylate synthase, partial [Sediminibacterium sp.]|nr:L-threonylcarbamoyladenylate synthase [Sediminibacterium sp.]
MQALIHQTASILKNKGIILYPTDTIWGLGCLTNFSDSIEKIYTIKNRPVHKSFIILVSSIPMLKRYIVNIDKELLKQISSFDKPTTIIYPEVQNLPKDVLATNGSAAIRIVKHPFCTPLIDEIDQPLVSTSANISNLPGPQNFTEIAHEIKLKVDFIVENIPEKFSIQKPSEIFEIQANNHLKKIR